MPRHQPMHFNPAKLVRVLSRSLLGLGAALSLATSLVTGAGCASGGGEAPAKGKDDNSAAKSEANEPIAGKPVEGEGAQNVATAPGAGTDEKEYALQIEPGEAKVGEEGKVSIRVVPQGEWHMNLEYPTKLEITPPTGTTVAKPKLSKDDAVALNEDGAEFAVAFTPTAAGDQTFTGEFKFAVCQDEACVPKTETLEFHVAVK